jgi:hypothetical protein
LERLRRAKGIDLNRVINDELNWLEGIDSTRVASQSGHGVSHCRQIYHCGDTSKILEQDTGGSERDLTGRGTGRPARQCLHIRRGDDDAVFGTQQILQKNPKRIRQPQDIDAGSRHGIKPEDLESPASDLQG